MRRKYKFRQRSSAESKSVEGVRGLRQRSYYQHYYNTDAEGQ
jgi:hypothetical protein